MRKRNVVIISCKIGLDIQAMLIKPMHKILSFAAEPREKIESACLHTIIIQPIEIVQP